MERAAYDRMRELQASHWWFAGRRTILGSLLSHHVADRKVRVAEAGCGVGGNIAMLQAFGEVSAMEPDPDSRAYVKSSTGVEPVHGLLPDELPWSPGAFDLVCAFDVIEHVDEDAASIVALAARLGPGGHLAVSVPAFQRLWSRHDEIHHHKRRYRLSEMTAMFETAGLEVVKASYFNTLLFPLAAAVRLAVRALGLKDGGEDKMPSAPVNGLLRRIFAAERLWLANAGFPFGLSIIVIGRKP
jgi:SAM-dependent methyltransferase